MPQQEKPAKRADRGYRLRITPSRSLDALMPRFRLPKNRAENAAAFRAFLWPENALQEENKNKKKNVMILKFDPAWQLSLYR